MRVRLPRSAAMEDAGHLARLLSEQAGDAALAAERAAALRQVVAQTAALLADAAGTRCAADGPGPQSAATDAAPPAPNAAAAAVLVVASAAAARKTAACATSPPAARLPGAALPESARAPLRAEARCVLQKAAPAQAEPPTANDVLQKEAAAAALLSREARSSKTSDWQRALPGVVRGPAPRRCPSGSQPRLPERSSSSVFESDAERPPPYLLKKARLFHYVLSGYAVQVSMPSAWAFSFRLALVDATLANVGAAWPKDMHFAGMRDGRILKLLVFSRAADAQRAQCLLHDAGGLPRAGEAAQAEFWTPADYTPWGVDPRFPAAKGALFSSADDL